MQLSDGTSIQASSVLPLPSAPVAVVVTDVLFHVLSPTFWTDISCPEA